MQIYLVGGAVRDFLLGIPSKERDWVVVGSTEAEMLSQGFVKVGKDFPVFLHPNTHEEYALARTERKVGKGYYGFECYAAPDVTLEQDLQRRDLTINAMAATVDKKGNIVDIIDPYHGQQDIKNHVLRHVSDAFKEDPVRILRAARFCARFFTLGFEIAPETMSLMQEMVNLGEVNELVPERVWQEWQRSLQEPIPALFLDVLHQCGALVKLFPALVNHIAESMVLLYDVSLLTDDPEIRFAATLLHSSSATELCQQYRVPGDYQELAVLVQEYCHSITVSDQLLPEKVLELLTKLDAWRRPERFEKVLKTCAVIAIEHGAGIDWLWKAYEMTRTIDPSEFVKQGLKGAEIQKALQAKRLSILKDLHES